MKPEVARPGDIVELNFRGVAVNGRLIPNSAPLQSDTHGRPLEHWRSAASQSSKANLGDCVI